MLHRFRRTFAVLNLVEIDAAHAGLRREGDEAGLGQVVQAPSAHALLLGENDDAAAFRRLVGQRGKLRGVEHVVHRDSRRGKKFHRLAIAERDRARFIEEKNVDVTGGFHGASAHGEDVFLHKTIDARDADGAEQSANRGGDETNQQRDEHRDGERHL